MACHKQRDGNHSTDSMIFWGGPGGFRDDNKLPLPADSAHETTFMDAGNVYTRRFELQYESPVHERPSSPTLVHAAANAQEEAEFETSPELPLG